MNLTEEFKDQVEFDFERGLISKRWRDKLLTKLEENYGRINTTTDTK